ncbi:aminotransferase, partial [Rhizobium ruizarguesonis]
MRIMRPFRQRFAAWLGSDEYGVAILKFVSQPPEDGTNFDCGPKCRLSMGNEMEEFHKVRRLPPYVFEQVNRLKASARAGGADIIDLG